MKKSITIQTTINAPVDKVWKFYTEPKHVMQWNNASADWHTPKAINDLKVGGTFNYRMESRDGSQGFDFNGTYNEIKKNEIIAYAIEDGREVIVEFHKSAARTKVTVTFEPENENPVEMQRGGWQSILDNFKRYVEKN
jgi:uncharacterized protein YndB with AHSA1/START domain